MNTVSANKLGYFPTKREPGKVVVPLMPEQAQMRGGYLHLMAMGQYFSGSAHGCMVVETPEQVAALKAALKAAPQEPTYSGSGSLYTQLSVVPDADGKGFSLMAGDVQVLRGIVDPTVKILSGDEDPKAQMEESDESDDLQD